MAPGEIVAIGDVALHNDGDQHMAVILDVQGDECEALFFTSNPTWSERSRRASKDEIAMAGFIQSKPTYLAYVRRPHWDFSPMGRSFPTHWVAALRTEFLQSPQVRQTM